MKKLAALTVVLAVLSLPGAAIAYVGPGAGLSLLGALWALVAAIVLAIGFVIAWPLRVLLRQKNATRNATGSRRDPHDDPREPGDGPERR